MEILPKVDLELYKTKHSSLTVSGAEGCIEIESMREMYKGFKKLGDMCVNNFETLDDALLIMKDDTNFENFKSYVVCELIGRNKKKRFDLTIKYEAKIITNEIVDTEKTNIVSIKLN